MSLRDAGHKLARVVPGAAAAVTARVPLPVAEFMGARVGGAAGRLPNRYHRRVLENLRLVWPQMGRAQRSALARRVMHHAGREALATMKWFGAGKRGRLPGLCANSGELAAAIEADRAGGRGAIYVGAHLGNPQILSALCATLVPVTGVGTEYHFRPHLGFVAEGRERLGLHYIPTDAPPLDLLRALQRNELVTFLPDVQPRRNNGLWLPFLGHPACTTTFPASLARLTGAVLRPVFLVREGRRYRAVIREPIATPAMAEGDAGLERAMRAWSAVLEQEIQARPEQWIWMSRRWRQPPRGHDGPAAASASSLRQGP